MAAYLSAKEKFTPPSKWQGEIYEKVLRWYFRPKYFGLEHLSKDKPALYVSNHTLLGITDGPIYMPKLYRKKDIYLRPLVDKMQKHIPIWRQFIDYYGLVIASKENCKELMKQKQHILVFPGGTNEAFKNDHEEYELIWKNRYGFVKIAIENGYPIIPVAGLGGDELYDIVFDKHDVMDSFIGKLIKSNKTANKYLKGGENIPPFVTGIGGTLLPKPKRIYYTFSEPIETKSLKGDTSKENLEVIRLKVELAIYKAMHHMTVYRQKKGSKTNSAIRNFLSR